MVGTLLRGVLPPVGCPIRLNPGPLPEFSGWAAVWLDSGTSALALALMCARERIIGAEVAGASASAAQAVPLEVILPGYGCPDLVAAAVFAGLKPVLVDVAPDDPGYDLEALAGALSTNTVAVVAVNFLGIGERMEAIRSLLDNHPGVALIEDDAQWYPEALGELSGDFVCLSFGRGKPVSLLGGGALLARPEAADLVKSVASRTCRGSALTDGIRYAAKTLAYNVALQRHVYSLIARLPRMQLGRTQYDPLEEIGAMGGRERFVSANAARWRGRSRELEGEMAAIVRGSPLVAADLPTQSGRARRLLRYPILCRSREDRDRLLAAGYAEGLGFTALYGSPLPSISGVGPRLADMPPLPQAHRFAERLLTLPLHQGVTSADVNRIRRLFAG